MHAAKAVRDSSLPASSLPLLDPRWHFLSEVSLSCLKCRIRCEQPQCGSGAFAATLYSRKSPKNNASIAVWRTHFAQWRELLCRLRRVGRVNATQNLFEMTFHGLVAEAGATGQGLPVAYYNGASPGRQYAFRLEGLD